ncbi:MAG: AEC family transporter [Deltaproteobacteria bacterium]|jgi:predicted permease|nr:AEC family transporter [Deltaproteobacteria bacterium]
MENIVLIFLCIAAGFLLRRLTPLPPDSYKAVNVWVLYVALPAMSLRYLPGVIWNTEMLLPVLGPFLLWGLAWVYAAIYARLKKIDKATRLVMLISCGLGNTGFLGFPLVSAFYGPEGMSIAIVFDMGVFILFCTVGVAAVLKTAGQGSGEKVKITYLLKRMIFFPAFLGCVSGLILPHFLDISPLYPLLDLFVPTVAPLGLFALGLQLEFKEYGRSAEHIAFALLYKLILSPLLVLGLSLLMGAKGLAAQVSVMQAGVGAHVTISLMASQFNQNPRLCGLMVGTSIACALVTVPLLYSMLKFVF